jgi:hypothetical protein
LAAGKEAREYEAVEKVSGKADSLKNIEEKD